MAKTGKNLGFYMQNKLARDSPRAGQLPIALQSLIHVIDPFMRGEAVLELTSDCVPPKATRSLSYIMLV